MATDIGLGGDVIVVTVMNVKMVGFQMANDGDMRGFFEIPKLEAGHFIDNNGVSGKIV